jgi:AraC-like DNA-binding protein
VTLPGSLVYAERAPAHALAQHVRCYWTLQGPTSIDGVWRVLPDGCADAIFEPARAARWVGTMTRAIEVRRVGRADIFGIRFAPGGLHALTGQPLHPFTDRDVDIRSADPLDLTRVEDELRATTDFVERCRLVDAALGRALAHAEPVAIAPMLGWLETQEDLPRVRALAIRAGMTARTLERRFQDALGVGPKQHLRFLRVERARRLIERGGLRGAEIAAAAHFSDEAHLIHEFRRFTGTTPSMYRARR